MKKNKVILILYITEAYFGKKIPIFQKCIKWSINMKIEKKKWKAFLIDIFVFYIVLYKQILVVYKHTTCLN